MYTFLVSAELYQVGTRGRRNAHLETSDDSGAGASGPAGSPWVFSAGVWVSPRTLQKV